MSRTFGIDIYPAGQSSSPSGFTLDPTQRPHSISGSEENGMNSAIDAASVSDSVENDINSSRNGASVGLGARILMSFARAKAAIIKESPPHYTRGAWAIINDVPYPPPPPYAGSSRHPPTYEDAMEIGVVASPLRVEQLMHCCSTEPLLPRIASAPQLLSIPSEPNTSASGRANPRQITEEGNHIPASSATVDSLPRYGDVDATTLLSPIVRRWKLGQPAFEKPPLHPKGYQYPVARRNSSQ
ncbi:hypothetical protein IW138_001129 [Coemansia sp. RSA 986]|nr:hypothetical protein LPJ74_000533 [Coemansia sp. RSA 1843]KAJ2092367.1 hypothetical protein IW138_001129 [Coemansia sp. RSA 986]